MSEKNFDSARLDKTTGVNAVNIEAQRKEALLKTGALQSAIVNSANFSIIATDEKGTIQLFNIGAERMLGYAATEIVNQITPAHIADPQEVIVRAAVLSHELGISIAPGFEAMVFKAMRGIEDIYELTYIRKNGSRFPALVSVTSLRDADSNIIGYLLSGTDNSARKKAEEELRWIDKSFRLMVDSVTDYAIVMLDSAGCVMSWNSGAQRIKGYSAEEIVGQHFSRFYPRKEIDRGTPQHDLDVVAAIGRFEDEGWRVRKDGTNFWAHVVFTAIRDEAGNLRGFAKLTQDLTKRRKAETRLKTRLSYLAKYDVLTELPNRSQLHDRLVAAIARAIRNEQLVGIMFLGLDRFQTVNATLGQHAGDLVLKETAARLRQCARKSDTVARMGGDEFCVILEGLVEKQGAAVVAQRQLESLSQSVLVDAHEVRPTASIGITIFSLDSDDINALLRNADVAMHYAKDCGRNNYQFYSPELDARTRRDELRRIEIEQRLAHLTPRESEVLDMIVAGKANKMVAYLLGTSSRTIENHRARIMEKMQADSLSDLVRMRHDSSA